MKLDLNQLLFTNQLLQGKSVYRYSGTYQADAESLSDHVYECMIIGYILGHKLISLGVDLDVNKLLGKLLIHDFDELLTGDVPRLTKYFSEDSKRVFKEIAEHSMKKLGEFYEMPHLVEDWQRCKEDEENPIESALVSLVDFICVLNKVNRELMVLNNLTFLKVAIELKEHIKVQWKGWYDREHPNPDLLDFFRSIYKACLDYLEKVIALHRSKTEYIPTSDKTWTQRTGIRNNKVLGV